MIVLLMVNGDYVLLTVNKNWGIEKKITKMIYYWWLARTDVIMTVNGYDALLMVKWDDVLLTVNKNWDIDDGWRIWCIVDGQPRWFIVNG